MKIDSVDVKSFLSSNLEFRIPKYQRPYKWEIKHAKKLFRDLVNNVSNEQVETYFLGTLVYIHNDKKNEYGFYTYYIIDGQQRITSLILLFIAMYHYILKRENNSNFESPIKSSFIYNNFLYILDDKEQSHLKLHLKPNDQEVLKELLQKGSSENKKSLLYKNYNYFYNAIKSNKENIYAIHDAFNKLKIVTIGLIEGKDNPQIIFERLNSTGKDLKIQDIFKNYLLMNFNTQEQEEYYIKYWKTIERKLNNSFNIFLLYYVSMKTGKHLVLSNLYDEFKNWINECEINKRFVLEDLYEFSIVYENISNENFNDLEINNAIKRLNILKPTTLDILLMMVLMDYKNKKILKTEVLQFLNLLENYFVRRFIAHFEKDGLIYDFAVFSSKLIYKEKGIPNYNESLIHFFDKKENMRSAYPTINDLNKSIYKNYYNNKEVLKFILVNIEKRLSIGIIDEEELTIEHIMPQKLNDEWINYLGENHLEIHERYLHTIGNLTLTGYNSRLGRKSFEYKKRIFAESFLEINKKVSLFSDWDEISIEKRTKYIISTVNILWPYYKKEVER